MCLSRVDCFVGLNWFTTIGVTTQFFWAAREIWAKPVFKEVSVLFFEEIDIFYFNPKSAW